METQIGRIEKTTCYRIDRKRNWDGPEEWLTNQIRPTLEEAQELLAYIAAISSDTYRIVRIKSTYEVVE